MEFFIWEQRLNTGIDIIDTQHRAIAGYINDLHAAIESPHKEMVGETLIRLLDYTSEHLTFEEQLMEAADYPGLEGHRATHGHFSRRIDRYFRHHYEGKAIATPLISELKLWLTTHILHEDNDFVPYIQRYLRGTELPAASRHAVPPLLGLALPGL